MGRLYEISAGTTSTITRFLYDGDDLVGEYDASGALLRRYAHAGGGGDSPIAWFEGASAVSTNARYLYSDVRGSVIGVMDASGNSIAVNSYDEFGIPAVKNRGRFQYTGQSWLSELGMYYFKARIYSPTLGRFLQSDPIGYGDGLNLYNYVGGDPVNFSDPTGTVAACKDDPYCVSSSTSASGGGSSSSSSSGGVYIPSAIESYYSYGSALYVSAPPPRLSAATLSYDASARLKQHSDSQQSGDDCTGKGFWNNLASGAETVSDYSGAGALGAAGIGLALAPTGVGFAGAELTAAGLGLVSTISSGVAAGANYMAGNNGRAAVNVVGMVGGRLIGGLAERGVARYLASGRMFGNLSAGQTRVAAYGGNFAGGFAGDAAKGAAAGICNAVAGR